MGDKTAIEWTHRPGTIGRTWNPWMGCRKVTRYGKAFGSVVRSKTTFNAPLKWKEPSTVFTCSWSDWFIEEADE